MNERRTLGRLGVIVAAGLMTVGLAAVPAYTIADSGGNGNGNGNSNADGNSNANANGNANSNANANGNGNGNGNGNDNGNGNGAGNDDNDNGNGGVDQMVICHVPPGNPDNEHTITVGEPAIDAHVDNHGDVLGPCDADTTTTTSTSTTSTSTTSTTTSTSTTTTTAPARAVGVSYRPTGTPPFCSVVVQIANFAPNQSVTVVLTLVPDVGGDSNSPWTFPGVVTDATGSAEFVPFSYSSNPFFGNAFIATVDGVSSARTYVTC